MDGVQWMTSLREHTGPRGMTRLSMCRMKVYVSAVVPPTGEERIAGILRVGCTQRGEFAPTWRGCEIDVGTLSADEAAGSSRLAAIRR